MELRSRSMYVNNDIDYMKFLKHKRVILFGAGKELSLIHI